MTKRTGIQWIAVAIAVAACVLTDAYADNADYGFHMLCGGDYDAHQIRVEPFQVEDSRVYDPSPQDCTLPSGRTVRARLGRGPVYPYGKGGAVPSIWLAVWIDKRKLERRIRVSCAGSEGPCSPRLVVTDDGYQVCSRELSPDGSTLATKESCESFSNQALPKERDAVEYPDKTDRIRPEPGTFVTMFSRDGPFCSKFDRLGDLGGAYTDDTNSLLNGVAGAQPIEEQRTNLPYGGPSHYGKYSFDINNDSKIETVIALHTRELGADGDRFYVFEGTGTPAAVSEDSDAATVLSTLQRSATAVIPDSWVKPRQGEIPSEGFGGEYRVKSIAAPWWDDRDEPRFEFSYWYLWPFRLDNTTYFLARSREAGRMHWYVLLRPEADYTVTEMCIFQAVPPNN